MRARLLNLLDRVPSWARPGLMIVLPLTLLGLLVIGFVLAGTGRHSEQASVTGRLLPPTPTAATPAPAQPTRTGEVQRPRTRSRAAHHPQVRGPVSEQPAAPPPNSAEGMMLAVARRFAVAYMPYQIGRLPRCARTAIEQTSTSAFAHYLLAQPAQLMPLQAAHPKTIETYRVASVEPAGAPETVAVNYISEQDSADTGEFLLRLVKDHGRWLVARLEA
jgi:hypothetical protein